MEAYVNDAMTYLRANPLIAGALGLVLLYLLIRQTKMLLFLVFLAVVAGGVLMFIADIAGKGGTVKTQMINQTGSQDVK
ncbi:MAG TPA: hypothetical protein VI078_11030 [bacterium]